MRGTVTLGPECDMCVDAEHGNLTVSQRRGAPLTRRQTLSFELSLSLARPEEVSNIAIAVWSLRCVPLPVGRVARQSFLQLQPRARAGARCFKLSIHGSYSYV
jgi:hypothetical protein